ncbi:hypothetical protein LMG28140_02627 [Paraburkholderia metrosideri]|jgi:hypothetical protein|uniref:Uncharacterized protein n=1 Tax=Paraburkholderia metrosideri TaxID=580937 RepID=A0ABN7HR53_9BURK|nr:hypothetical protein LMG28140_02627 [Paraburkholderia metrosideri]
MGDGGRFNMDVIRHCFFERVCADYPPESEHFTASPVDLVDSRAMAMAAMAIFAVLTLVLLIFFCAKNKADPCVRMPVCGSRKLRRQYG